MLSPLKELHATLIPSPLLRALCTRLFSCTSKQSTSLCPFQTVCAFPFALCINLLQTCMVSLLLPPHLSLSSPSSFLFPLLESINVLSAIHLMQNYSYRNYNCVKQTIGTSNVLYFLILMQFLCMYIRFYPLVPEYFSG